MNPPFRSESGQPHYALGMVTPMADMQTWITTLSLTAPLPAGAFVAAIPAAAIKKRALSGLSGTALAAVGWFVNPIVGIATTSAGLWVATNRHTRRGRLLAKFAAVLPPIAAYIAYVWAAPHSGAALPVRNPVPSAVLAVMVGVAVGVIVKRLQPELDPERMFSAAQRAEVIARDGNHCSYCGAPGDGLGVRLEMDHVIPHSAGGRTDVDNAALACGVCNSLKGGKGWDDFVDVFRDKFGFAPGEYDRPGLLRRIFSF